MQAEGEIVQLPEQRVGSKDFRTFFEDEHRRLYKTLYFVTGDRAEAADLMQEAFLKLWERWSGSTPSRIRSPTWFKVALNGNRMRARAARRAPRRQIPLGIVRDPFDDVDLREDVLQMLLAGDALLVERLG
jgi:DNA-directed RNA polymerase specialized sigma24 family protein